MKANSQKQRCLALRLSLYVKVKSICLLHFYVTSAAIVAVS